MVLWLVGLVTAAMTAFYMWRLMSMTFYGKSRVKPEVAAHVHESPAVMTVPLIALAAGSVLAGWLGVPKLWTIFSDSLPRVSALAGAGVCASAAAEGTHPASTEWSLMILSVAVAAGGISLAYYLYAKRPDIPDRIWSASGRCTRCSTTNGTWMSCTIFFSSTAWAKAAAAPWRSSTARLWMAASTARAG